MKNMLIRQPMIKRSDLHRRLFAMCSRCTARLSRLLTNPCIKRGKNVLNRTKTSAARVKSRSSGWLTLDSQSHCPLATKSEVATVLRSSSKNTMKQNRQALMDTNL
mmetsp:Transcript_79368/g.157259  ORF Transcript_79368/g.157259 Transcript_79368/m.157259 type:complete len:106 (+) Transcript_79368:191-508(+)